MMLSHSKGETVIEERPHKVGILYYSVWEHLFTIGEQDVVAGIVCSPFTSRFWPTAASKISETKPVCKILLELEPDVIITWEQDEPMYDQLSKIAKTFVIPRSENWQDTITKVADVIREAEKE